MEEKCKINDNTINLLQQSLAGKDQIIAKLEARMVDSEQYAHNKNIAIINVEQKQDENLEEIMNKLAKEWDVRLNPGDIDVMHRVPTRREGAHPKIIVQFTTRTIQERWLEKRRQGVALEEILDGATGEKTVFIYRHLTEHWRDLYKTSFFPHFRRQQFCGCNNFTWRFLSVNTCLYC